MWHTRITLRPGARGPAVQSLRWRLSALGYAPPAGGPDEPPARAFDRELEAAVRDFQAACGLVPDGVVGPATWRALLAGHPAVLAPTHASPGTRSPWAPPAGEAPASRIEVRLDERLLIVHGPGGPTAFPAAVGRPDAPSPVGRFAVSELIPHPGPPLGTRWIRLHPDLCSIHGTDEPWLVGAAATPGCIRLYNKDVEYVFHRVVPGTPVEIRP